MDKELTLQASPFDLGATLMCGQAFRWTPLTNGAYSGVVRGVAAEIRQDGKTIHLKLHGKKDIAESDAMEEDFWRSYLALDIDYAKLHRLYRKDPMLKKCVDFAPGIRVLRQDFYETFISFIVSQNNNISRIRSIIAKMCELFGDAAGKDSIGNTLYSFPSAKKLGSLTEDDLAPLKTGYRAPSILGAARLVLGGNISENELRSLNAEDARKKHLTVHGVGPKVADCVLLFGLAKFEGFPKDVWIKRAMAELFPDGLPDSIIATAGIAQQYIFHYMRSEASLAKLKVES